MAGWRPAAWLAVATFLLYAPTLFHGFSPLDDDLLILGRIEWLQDPGNLLQAFREGVFPGKQENFYRPLLTASFMLDTSLGGGAPWVYHLTNVTLHVAAVLLVFMVLGRLGASRPTGFALALLFAIHPAFAHAVAWLPGRNDPLLAILVLAAFLAFDRWADRGRPGWVLAHVALFLLALFTKESAVLLLPLLLLELWLGRRKRFTPRVVLPPAVGWAIALATWFALRHFYGGTNTPGRWDIETLREFLSACLVLFGEMILPLQTSVVPNIPDLSLLPGIVALVLGVTIALRAGFRRPRIAAFGAVWFVVFLALPTLVGSSGVVMRIHHEHRLYLPAVGLLVALSQMRFERLGLGRPGRLAVFVAVLGLAFAARTTSRISAYRDAVSFGNHAVAESPTLALSWKLRGDAYLAAKRYREAIADFQRAVALRPRFGGALANLAKAQYESGDPAKTIENYTRAIAAEPEDSEHRANRAFVYFTSSDWARAIADCDVVLARRPHHTGALHTRGKALISSGGYDRAVADFSTAIEVNPRDGEAYHNRAVALFYLGNYDGAWTDVEAAQRLGIAVMPQFLDDLERASGR